MLFRSFLDPKGRGAVTGYDMAVALPGLQNSVDGDEELFKVRFLLSFCALVFDFD